MKDLTLLITELFEETSIMWIHIFIFLVTPIVLPIYFVAAIIRFVLTSIGKTYRDVF